MKERPQIEIVGWLPSAEAAKRLKIEQGTIRQLVHKDKLYLHYIGSRLYVSEESVNRYVATRGSRQGGRPRKTPAAAITQQESCSADIAEYF